MLNYALFCSSAHHWFDLACQIEKEKIGKLVFSVVDDLRLDEFESKFGQENVFSLKEIRFNSDFIDKDFPVIKDTSFFFSENYRVSKEICLKMMDRIDKAGVLTRIDREAWYNKIIIWSLKIIERKNIDFLIMSEAPHNHAQYAIYEIFKYKKIPAYKFGIWLPIPALYLQNAISGERIPVEYEYTDRIKKNFRDGIKKFAKKILNQKSNIRYEASHINEQRTLSNSIAWKFSIFYKKFKKDVKTFLKSYVKQKKYNPLNPHSFSPFYRRVLIRSRIKNLRRSSKVAKKLIPEKKFVYFPLHYEPERSTTPDGGEFHDQLKAIIAIRAWLPRDILLVVKEHPSQFFPVRYGYQGRSPLFYELINSISGVYLLEETISTVDLISKSELVISITGTVAVEAAIMGIKSVLLSEAWFYDIPNIYSWNQEISFEDIIEQEVAGSAFVIESIINSFEKTTIPAFQNKSNLSRYKEFIDDYFYMEQSLALKKAFQAICKLVEKTSE